MVYYSGLVCIAPYLNVYYKRLGISEQQIGFLAALSPWVNASSGDVHADHTALAYTTCECSISSGIFLLQVQFGLLLLTGHAGTRAC